MARDPKILVTGHRTLLRAGLVSGLGADRCLACATGAQQVTEEWYCGR
jgi:hypothetical protein